MLSQTLERAAEIRLETTLLPVWYDVDDVGSLRRYARNCFPDGAARRPMRLRATPRLTLGSILAS